jgi:hypothetical protein
MQKTLSYIGGEMKHFIVIVVVATLLVFSSCSAARFDAAILSAIQCIFLSNYLCQ